MFNHPVRLQFSAFRFIIYYILFCFTCIDAHAQSRILQNKNHAAIALETSNYDVYYYYLQLWADMQKQTIHGANTIHFTALEDLDSLQVDLFAQYEIAGATYKGQQLKYVRNGNKITIHLPEKISKNNKANIQIHYAGTPPVAKKAPWEGGFVWTKDSLGRPWAAVACEQLGASSWWPCKDDWEDEPDSMHLTINVPRGMFCVSNGQLRKMYVPEDERFTAFDWYVTYPVNLYDITINIGYYERIRDYYTSERKDFEGKPISYLVDYFFMDYNVKKVKAFFADSIYGRTKTMLRTFEYLFGVYPFYRDGYALVEAPYWGMEHQSAVAYGNNFKLNDFGFDFILIHESAHEWWGNAVTASDAGDMWIHESFTTYAEALFSERLYGYEKSVQYLKMQKPNIKNQLPVQGPRCIHFHDRTDNDIYYKGSWMLHTLRSVLDNDTLWFSMLYNLQQHFRYKTISTEDVINYIEKYSGRNLEAFFRQYLYENALPVFEYSITAKSNKRELKYRWRSPVKGFDMPLDVFINGEKIRLQPTTFFQKQNLEHTGQVPEIKIDTDRFLITVLYDI